MKRTFLAALMGLIIVNTIAPMAPDNSSNSLTKYIAPTLKIAAGLGGLALTAYSCNSILKSRELSSEEVKFVYLSPLLPKSQPSVGELLYKRLATTFWHNNLLLLPFTAIASTYFLASGITDVTKIYKQSNK